MTLTVELTIEQIAGAIRRLNPDERLALFRLVTAGALTDEPESNASTSQVAEEKVDYGIARAELDFELAAAAKVLLPDYINDKDLTAFTALDSQDFHTEG